VKRTSASRRWPHRRPHHRGSPDTPSRHGSLSPGRDPCPTLCPGAGNETTDRVTLQGPALDWCAFTGPCLKHIAGDLARCTQN
jgi:hypothetical protein